MPCPFYDELQQEWSRAVHEHSRALNPDAQVAAGMSGAKLADWRVRAWSNLGRSESRINAHIEICPACKIDGRPQMNLADAKE
jgi:hypothetical protein